MVSRKTHLRYISGSVLCDPGKQKPAGEVAVIDPKDLLPGDNRENGTQPSAPGPCGSASNSKIEQPVDEDEELPCTD